MDTITLTPYVRESNEDEWRPVDPVTREAETETQMLVVVAWLGYWIEVMNNVQVRLEWAGTFEGNREGPFSRDCGVDAYK